MAKAILEPLVAEMRIHDDDNAVYGDEYQFGVVVRYLTPTSVQIDGLKNDMRFTLSHAAAVRAELKRYGVTEYSFKRMKNGVETLAIGHIN